MKKAALAVLLLGAALCIPEMCIRDRAYRLQAACQMLAKGQEAVTVISHECGLGSSSYFGKVFREYTCLLYTSRCV